MKNEVVSIEGEMASPYNFSLNKACPAPQALLEIGVKTGLSLIFTLLNQNWQTGQGSICNNVLETACSVVSNLPPLSLANESQLSRLGTESLQQVTEFLSEVALPQSGADYKGLYQGNFFNLCLQSLQ